MWRLLVAFVSLGKVQTLLLLLRKKAEKTAELS
jgi:hypothetical protein